MKFDGLNAPVVESRVRVPPYPFASGECVGVTRSNYSPVATKLNEYMKLETAVFGMPLMQRKVPAIIQPDLGTP